MGETIHRIRTGHPYWTWGFIIWMIIMVVVAIYTNDHSLEARLIIAFVVLSLLLALPDMNTYFGVDGILLTFGVGGIWKKRIRKDEIAGISVTPFSGLWQFGGWGIKYGTGKFKGTIMWGMPVRGSRGIWISTKKGRKYLIPDPDPDMTIEYIKNYFPVDVTSLYNT